MYLVDLKRGTKFMAKFIPNLELVRLGLCIGTTGVVTAICFGGARVVQFHGQELAIGKELAKLIQVEEI